MTDLKKLEEFLVNTDDVVSLIELYATRIKSYPGNRAYYQALSLQCGEFLLASKRLKNKEMTEAVQSLYKIGKLLNEKRLTATTHQMEIFIEELQDITAYLKHLFTDKEVNRKYASQNIMVLKNFIRQLSREEVHAESFLKLSVQDIVEDPFDEIEGLGDFVDSFADDLDQAFDSILKTPGEEDVSIEPSGHMSLSDHEQTEVENLFLSISGAYIQPVKDFISQLSGGAVSKNWVDICMSSLRIIEDAGTKMSYEKITRILQRFKTLMLQAKTSGSSVITREIRLQLLKEYANLTALMPEAFATSTNHASRGSLKDGVIVNVLLRKIHGIGPISRNKLIAAGLNTLEKYYMATPDDLAQVSGLTMAQAESICRAFAEYRENVKAKTNRSTKTQVSLARLYKHLRDLKQTQEAYKLATRMALYSQDYESERNELRQKRLACMWDINIILAELDALKMVEDFRRMIFDRRIELLDQFLEEQAKKYF